MPHERARHVFGLLQKLLAHSPLVGVLGHRQVGKTTLLNQVVDHYITLDNPNFLGQARISPSEFVKENATNRTAIDECQLAPELFPALKEWVRTHKKPGQFLMSGSVRFTSRQAIRESLTGRIMNAELFPFGVAELLSLELPNKISDLPLDSYCTKKEHTARSKFIDEYLIKGGLPGICFIRDIKTRNKKIEEQLYTIIDRDLRSVIPIQVPYRQIINFITELAVVEGEPLNHQDLKQKTGLSPVTQKKILYALEAVFILRAHTVNSDRTHLAYFFEDQAEWTWFINQGEERIQNYQKKAWTGLLYRNLRLPYEYRLGENATYFGYRTRSGVNIPLAIRTPEQTIGILPIIEKELSHRDILWSQSFLKKYSNSNVYCISKTLDKPKKVQDRIWILPATHVLF